MSKILLRAAASCGMMFLSAICQYAHAEPAAKNAVSAVELFQRYCLAAPPGFTSINQQASTAGYRIFQDRRISPVVHQKSWLVPDPSNGAPLLLNVESGPSRDGTENVTLCGVSAMGAAGPDLRRALSAEVALGHPIKVISPAPNGGTLVFWSVRFPGSSQAGNARVMLIYGVPGMRINPINLIFRQKR